MRGTIKQQQARRLVAARWYGHLNHKLTPRNPDDAAVALESEWDDLSPGELPSVARASPEE